MFCNHHKGDKFHATIHLYMCMCVYIYIILCKYFIWMVLFSLSPSLLFHFLSSPHIFFFTFFFWCERFDIYIGFGQGSEKGNGFICGLSIRSGYFLKTHEKKYMYIYKYELWRGFQFNKFESFFLKYQWWGIYDEFCVGFFDRTIHDRGGLGCSGRANTMNTSSIDLSLGHLAWMIPADPKTYTFVKQKSFSVTEKINTSNNLCELKKSQNNSNHQF